MVDQGGDVLAALAQGRSLDREDVEAIEQILTEGAGANLLGRVPVGGRDDSDINLDRAFGADGVDLALLQGAQQFDLHVQRQFADLVEEQGAAVGFLELAEVFVVGTGKGPLFMAEQDGLDQVGGQGSAVDGHEGFSAAIRGTVQGAGDDFLADAALAGDQDRNRGFGGPGPQRLDHAHGRAGAHQIVEGGAAGDVFPEAAHLGGQPGHLQGIGDAHQQPFGGDRLDEEVLGSGLHGLDDRIDAAGGGQDDDGCGHACGADLGEGLHAAHAGHDHVEQDDVGPAALGQAVDGLAAGLGVYDGIALALQHGLSEAALGRIVVDHENGLGHGTPFNITVTAGPR